MNGYMLSPGRYLTATTGADTSRGGAASRILIDRVEFTDIWGTRENIKKELANDPTAYIAESRGKFVASVTTERGRVFYHDKESDAWEPPTGLSAADTMLLLDRLASLLRRRALQYNPGYRGITILGSTRDRNPDWFKHEELPEEHTADPVPNFTENIKYNPALQWLHKYDTRAAWLAAARTAPTGYGARQLIPHWNEKVEALWLVKSTTEHQPRPINRSGWYPTAIVRAALAISQPIEIKFGWGWQHQCTALRSFSEGIIRARSDSIMAGGDIERGRWLEGAIKRVYTRTFGKLQNGDKGRAWSKQPYWYLSLRAESARRMWRVYNSHPEAIGVDTDTIYILSANPSAYASFGAGSMSVSPHAWNPGTWRYERSYPVTRELFSVLGGTGAVLTDYLRKRESVDMWDKGE